MVESDDIFVDLRDIFEDGKKYVPDDVKMRNERVIKANIIDEDGSSEGVWVYVIHPEDMEKYNRGNPTDTYDVVLLNQPLTHLPLLRLGFVIRVKGTGKDTRPVLDNNWFKAQRNKIVQMQRAKEKANKKA